MLFPLLFISDFAVMQPALIKQVLNNKKNNILFIGSLF
ncbi:hypothetical protein [Acinetobacter bereziniae]|nr:hypothetical protein [Acinetobacter bereziniae]